MSLWVEDVSAEETREKIVLTTHWSELNATGRRDWKCKAIKAQITNNIGRGKEWKMKNWKALFLWSGGVHLINWESYLEGSMAIKSFISIITQYQQSNKNLSCSWHFMKCVTITSRCVWGGPEGSLVRAERERFLKYLVLRNLWKIIVREKWSQNWEPSEL